MLTEPQVEGVRVCVRVTLTVPQPEGVWVPVLDTLTVTLPEADRHTVAGAPDLEVVKLAVRQPDTVRVGVTVEHRVRLTLGVRLTKVAMAVGLWVVERVLLSVMLSVRVLGRVRDTVTERDLVRDAVRETDLVLHPDAVRERDEKAEGDASDCSLGKRHSRRRIFRSTAILESAAASSCLLQENENKWKGCRPREGRRAGVCSSQQPTTRQPATSQQGEGDRGRKKKIFL